MRSAYIPGVQVASGLGVGIVLKGSVTNVAAAVMPTAEVIANRHDLWHVEGCGLLAVVDDFGLERSVDR